MQALEPSAPGPSGFGADRRQEPQLPLKCAVASVLSLSSGPHDAGHLLQQQAVVPVDDGEPLLLQLRTDTQRIRAATVGFAEQTPSTPSFL